MDIFCNGKYCLTLKYFDIALSIKSFTLIFLSISNHIVVASFKSFVIFISSLKSLFVSKTFLDIVMENLIENNNFETLKYLKNNFINKKINITDIYSRQFIFGGKYEKKSLYW